MFAVDHSTLVAPAPFEGHRETAVLFPPADVSLAKATRAAVQAAGGLKVCAHEAGVSDSQLSRCESVNHRDSISVRAAVKIDALALAKKGVAPILCAQARAHGFLLVALPAGPQNAACLMQSVGELTAELGEVARGINDAVSVGSAGGREVTKDEAEAILEQLDDMDRASAALRLKLNMLAGTSEFARQQ